MSLLASLAYFAAALLVGGLALTALLTAGQRERQEQILLRLRAAAGDAAGVAMAGPVPIRNPLVRAVCHLLWRAGAEPDPAAVSRALLWSLLPAALLPMVLGPWLGLGVLTLLAALAWAVLVQRASARRAQVVSQLPEYLEGVIRVLSAGNTLEESLAAAARDSEEPARALFLSIGRQVRLGAPVEAVLSEAAEIHRLRDLRALALAAAINRRYGGSLRNILRSLMAAIRGRDVAQRELKALTAETRFSAWVLALIPMLLTAYIFVQNRAYYSDMWVQPGGRAALIAAVLLQIAGVAVLFRMMGSAGGAQE